MENTNDNSLNLEVLKTKFLTEFRRAIGTPGIIGDLFIAFLEEMKIQFCNDPDIELVYTISNNMHILKEYKFHIAGATVERFMSQISLTNVKSDRIMKKILTQFQVIINYRIQEVMELFERISKEIKEEEIKS